MIKMSCDTEAPLLVTHYTAIAIAGPILCICFTFFMFGCNLVGRKYHPLCRYLWPAWLIALLAVAWFWSAFMAGFVPEYIKSLYLPANATLTNTSVSSYQCTELHNCFCSQSFDKPCAVVENELMNTSSLGTTSAPCAGQSCCARRIYRCTRYENRCTNSRCTRVCAFGFYECIVPVAASRCTAVGGTCRKATADYEFTTRCNQTVTSHFEVTCRINDQNCVRNFEDANPEERVIYYAPWDPTKQTVRYVEPKGQIVNILFPLLIMFALLAAQVIVVFALLMKCFQQRDSASGTSATSATSATSGLATSSVL